MPQRKRRVRKTHFSEWLKATGRDYLDIAHQLGEGEGRIRHYVTGLNIPKPEMVKRLKAITGLPSDAFLFPFEPLESSDVNTSVSSGLS